MASQRKSKRWSFLLGSWVKNYLIIHFLIWHFSFVFVNFCGKNQYFFFSVICGMILKNIPFNISDWVCVEFNSKRD